METRRKEEPVEIDGRRHVLRELTAKGRHLFLTEERAKEAAAAKGVSVAERPCTEAHLLGLTLFDEAGAPIKAEVIDAWPAGLVVALAVRSAFLSGLAEGNGARASAASSTRSPSAGAVPSESSRRS